MDDSSESLHDGVEGGCPDRHLGLLLLLLLLQLQRKLIEIMDRSTGLALVFLSVDRYSEK